MKPTRVIVQAARTIGPGYGVSGPSYELERAFQKLGCQCRRFTMEDLGIRTQAMPTGFPPLALARFWRDVLLFSTLGSALLAWRNRVRPPGTVVLCQVDALFGDIFVVRALHKGFLLEQSRSRRIAMLVRNPMHLFVLARDWLRFHLPIHRRFVALSPANKDQLMALYPVSSEQICVIRNGVDCERFRPCPLARSQIRSQLGWSEEHRVAIFAGHEFARKGLESVLEALRHPELRWKLIVAGRDDPAPLRRRFSDLSERVQFVGNRTDLERYYAAADLFVMPSRFDISPLVGPEALSSGLPLLMTDVGGVRDYLVPGVNGLFTEPGGLAEHLLQLQRSPETLAALAAEARASVADRDWLRIAERYLALMDELA